MRARLPKNRRIALVLSAALWPACGADSEAPADHGATAGAGGGLGLGGTGGSAATDAGAGGTPAATAGSGGSGGDSGGTSGSGGSAGDSTCELACDHAVACLTTGTLCAEVTAQDADAIATGCGEICAAMSSEFEALAEHADRCGLALKVVVDNADLASRPGRDVLERCAPSGVCEAACDTVGFCASSACEDLGAVGSELFSACIQQCSVDASWADGVNSARAATGCSAALQVYDAERPGTLPAGCAGRN